MWRCLDQYQNSETLKLTTSIALANKTRRRAVVEQNATDGFSSLDELIDAALTRRWCTAPYCTTCGSTDFRQALSAMPREVVVGGLRSLDGDFHPDQSEIITSILLQVAHRDDGCDIQESLAGTPAARFLEKAIQHQDEMRATRQEWESSPTPAAVEQRRIQGKNDAAANRSMRRDQSADTFAWIRSKFDDMPARLLLKEAFMAD